MSLGYTQSDIQNMILAAALQKGVDPALALAVAQTESSFNPNAISPAGAIGVMQLMPATAAGLGVDPNNVQQNIDGGVQLLANYLTQYNGNLQQVLWAYNAGPGNVAKGILPSETANYIPTVLGAIDQFSNLYPSDTSTTDTSGTTDSTGTVSILGYDVPTTTVLAGGIGLAALLWLWLR